VDGGRLWARAAALSPNSNGNWTLTPNSEVLDFLHEMEASPVDSFSRWYREHMLDVTMA